MYTSTYHLDGPQVLFVLLQMKQHQNHQDGSGRCERVFVFFWVRTGSGPGSVVTFDHSSKSETCRTPDVLVLVLLELLDEFLSACLVLPVWFWFWLVWVSFCFFWLFLSLYIFNLKYLDNPVTGPPGLPEPEPSHEDSFDKNILMVMKLSIIIIIIRTGRTQVR